jgi:hypothetical protein
LLLASVCDNQSSEDLHDIPNFFKYKQILSRNNKLANSETGEKDVKMTELAERWIFMVA